MTSKVSSKSEQLRSPLTDVGCGLQDASVPGSRRRMCVLWGVVYPVWILAAVSCLDLLFKRLPTALLRCSLCTISSACLRSSNFKMDLQNESVLPQLFVENLLSIHQALCGYLSYLGNTGPASMGETGKCSTRRAISWEMQEMAETEQKRAREWGLGR